MTSISDCLLKRVGRAASGLVWLFASTGAVHADEPVTYLLLPDSVLTDDCPICGRPTIPEPMAGRFQLRTLGDNGLYITYAVENFTFVAGRDEVVEYSGAGFGTYQQGGEVAITQDSFLDITITNGVAVTRALFTNSTRLVPLSFPNLRLRLTQTNGTFLHTLSLDLHAEPLKEIPLRVVAADRFKVTLAWPLEYGGATVFRAARLGPLPDWQEVTVKATPVSSEYQATLAVTNAVGYLRLHIP